MHFSDNKRFLKSLLALVLTFGILISDLGTARAFAEGTSTQNTSESSVDTSQSGTESSGSWAGHTPIVKSDTELRGIWLAVVDYYNLGVRYQDSTGKVVSEATYRSKLAKFANSAKELGSNAVFMHVRSFDDAIWPSKNFNANSYFTNTASSKKKASKVYTKYDPLKVAIEEIHRAGLEFHAYMNPYRVSTSAYLDPGKASSRSRVMTAIKEVCQYDIDGVHFDDYFYHSSKYIDPDNPSRKYSVSISAAKKRSNVNKLIRAVYKEVSSHHGQVFGIAPQGNLDNDRASGADVETWAKKDGYVDYIAPQIYWTDAYGSEGDVTMFTDRLKQFKNLQTNPNVRFYVGLALYFCGGAQLNSSDRGWLESSANLKKQVKKIRKVGGSGYILFTGRFLYFSATKKERNNLAKFLGVGKYAPQTTAATATVRTLAAPATVTSLVKVDTAVNKGAAKSGWVKAANGKKMYYKNGKYVTGAVKISKKYYYFTAEGYLKTSDFKIGKAKYYVGEDSVLMGIKTGKNYCYATGIAMTDADKAEFKTYLKARSIVKKVTNDKMTKSEKRLACMKWVQSHPYKLSRKFTPSQTDWTAKYAMDVYTRGGSDCHGDSAAFAYLAIALGYDKVYICNDSDGTRGTAGGHCWCEIDGRIFDPLFSEARGFGEHYNVPKAGYYGHPVIHKKVMYMSPSHATTGVVLVESKEGLAKVNGEYYFFKGGKAVTGAWKSVDDNKYYFGDNGKAYRGGTFEIDDVYYIFKNDGKLARDEDVHVITIGGKKYRVAASGRAKSGWEDEYFYDAAGRLVTGTVAIGGSLWVFSNKGVFNESETGLYQAAMIPDSPIEGVVEILGQPKLSDYSPSCLAGEEDSEDGTWEYDNYYVVTLRRPDGTELFKTVLPADPILEETKIKMPAA